MGYFDGAFPFWWWTNQAGWNGGFPTGPGLPAPTPVHPTVTGAVVPPSNWYVVRVSFSKSMLVNAALTDPANYGIIGYPLGSIVSISVVTGSGDQQVDVLLNKRPYSSSLYVIAVENVQDSDGSYIDSQHNTASFYGLYIKLGLNIIWVATTGSDITGDGTYDKPYLTIEKGVSVMESGDQVRVLDGTYVPVDSIVIDGMDGSIFAENPSEVTVQPARTSTHPACIAILNSARFFLLGINVLQTESTTPKNLYGIYAENSVNFICQLCKVMTFSDATDVVKGIYAQGTGRIEGCTVADITSGGTHAYGIHAIGPDVIDCDVGTIVCEGTAIGIQAESTP